MNEDEKKYEFTLLTDEIADTDYFEEQTHEKVAETLYKLICSNENGFTIGLEGSWGSGKSTVISLLKKKIEQNQFCYFYFDAWAHEGDHLRQIFLESLLSQLDTGSDNFKELSDKISNHMRTTTTRTEQHGTNLGKLLAASFLLVPLGASLVSGVDILQLSFKLGGNPQWMFLCGVFFSLMPVWVIIFNIGYLLQFKKVGLKKIFDGNNWVFLESNNNRTVTQEISDEEERSSIEFEKFFRQIMIEVFEVNTSDKLIIVIDNLDRIDANDSLKIWSTLQTFLQQRNPSNSDNQWYKNIWIIVPYDMNGLSKLWNKEGIFDEKSNHIGTTNNDCNSITNDNNNTNDDNSNTNDINGSTNFYGNGLNSCAKSFFDKCFQIRIDVPEPVLTGWEQFTKEMLDKALDGWDVKDKDCVLRILKLTRKDIGDAPTPREIKNYINQTGILRMHHSKQIPIDSIAYYSIHKYLRGASTHSIKTRLLDGSLPILKDKIFLPSECSKHLAGIIYGVEPETGQQLLLEPEIKNILQNSSGNELMNLAKKHEGGFWSVFEYHINNLDVTDALFSYSKAIYEGLWETNPEKCSKFLVKIEEFFRSGSPLVATGRRTESYIPIIKMINDVSLLKHIWNHILTNIEIFMGEKDAISYEEDVLALETIAEYFDNSINNPDDKLSSRTFQNVISENWVKWAQEVDSHKIPAYRWILPPQNIVTEIALNIGASSPIVPGTKELLIYSTNAGIVDWEDLPSACRDHIFQNNGTLINENQPSIEVLDILLWLTSHEFCKPDIKQILESGQFHNFIHHQINNKAKIYSALLMAYYFKNGLHDISLTPVANSNNGLQEMRDVWLKKSDENAKEMYSSLKEFDFVNLLWDLAENKNHQLVVAIINLAIEDQNSAFFNCSDTLNKLGYVVELVDDVNDLMLGKVVNQLLEHSDLKNEIMQTQNPDISNFSIEFFLIVKNTDDEEIIDKISSAIIGLEEDEWSNYFDQDTYLVNLALEVQNKKSAFGLKNTYSDSIFEFAKKWYDSGEIASEWQKDNWTSLVNLMEENFQTQYKKRITRLQLDKNFNGSDEFYDQNINFFDYQKLFNDGRDKIQALVEDAVKDDGDFDTLMLLDSILIKDTNNDFTPDTYVASVISDDLNKLYFAEEQMDRKDILRRLAVKFGVKLKEQKLESEVEKDYQN